MRKNSVLNLAGTILICLLAMQTAFAQVKNELSIYQVMQRVLDRYPSLKIAGLEVEQAKQLKQQVESNLGWILNGSAGMSHDLTGFSVPSDRLDLNASLERKLESGATLSLSGGYSYEDSSSTFIPTLPNPVHSTKLDLSYRLPLSQGEGNPDYAEGINSANADFQLAKASQLQTRIALAEQVKDLFFAAAITNARLDNAKLAVERAKKLEKYINKNFNLGLAEEQDKLQVKAQLQSKLAELSAIQLQWQQQKTALNRLMIEEWDQSIQPKLVNNENIINYDLQELFKITDDYHPAVYINQAKLNLAESQINIARDSQKDNLDLVVSVGTRTSNGDNATSSVSEEDLAGSVRIEYKHLLDEKGVNSKYKQAQLQRHIAMQEIQKTHNDIRYTVSGLVAEINAAQQAVNTAKRQLKSESLKLKEAAERYRIGRTDTAQLIQFENEYSFAQLSYQQQKIELNNRIIALQIFTGKFWHQLETGLNVEPISGQGASK